MTENKSSTFLVSDFGNTMFEIEHTTEEFASYGSDMEYVNMSTHLDQMGKSTTRISVEICPAVSAHYYVIICSSIR